MFGTKDRFRYSIHCNPNILYGTECIGVRVGKTLNNANNGCKGRMSSVESEIKRGVIDYQAFLSIGLATIILFLCTKF